MAIAMTSRQLYEGVLIELNKENAPNLILEDFNYFANKAINQYVNKRYNIYDINQQTTDDLRVLKATAMLTPQRLSEYDDLTLTTSGMATYYVDLPSDYLHLLNCICIYNVKKTYKCYNAGDTWRAAATRLTADAYSQVLDNFWLKPTYKRPYYYIHNINTLEDNPTNPYNSNTKSGTDIKSVNTSNIKSQGYFGVDSEGYLNFTYNNIIYYFVNKNNTSKFLKAMKSSSNTEYTTLLEVSTAPSSVSNLLTYISETIYKNLMEEVFIAEDIPSIKDDLVPSDSSIEYNSSNPMLTSTSSSSEGVRSFRGIPIIVYTVNLTNNIKVSLNKVISYLNSEELLGVAIEVSNSDGNGNPIAIVEQGIPKTISIFGTEYSNVEHSAGVRYGNVSKVRMEIRYGTDNSVFTLDHENSGPLSRGGKIYIDYIKAPLHIRLTQEQLDYTEDKSQMLEFPDYVCQEILNELVHIVMENILDQRLQTHPVVSLSIANPAQALAPEAAG